MSPTDTFLVPLLFLGFSRASRLDAPPSCCRGGDESRPYNRIHISRKPRPVPACGRQGRGASLFHAKMFFFLFHFLMKPDFYQGTAVNAYFFSDFIDISNE